MSVTDTKIATKRGLLEVKALLTETPGLVLTRAAFSDPVKARLGLWAVTHAASGHAFAASLPNREIAALVAAWLGRIGVDWTRDMDAILADDAAASAFYQLTPLSDGMLDAVCALLTGIGYGATPKRRRCTGGAR